MDVSSVFLIFPHQLFKNISLLKNAGRIYIVEEFLFFNQYKFHQQKLHFHRATMKYYESYLKENGLETAYIDALSEACNIKILIENLAKIHVSEVQYYDVSDFWLEKRIGQSAKKFQIKTIEHASPLFINTKSDLKTYFEGKKRFFQTDFYIQQRKKLNILLNADSTPLGSKWSYDTDNRLKYPKNKKPPKLNFPVKNSFFDEATDYIQKNYAQNYGLLSDEIIYPNTHKDAEEWMIQFFENRFSEFGEYEDAIVSNEVILHHSLLSPLLNVGLLLPMQVVHAALTYAEKNEVPLNSLEGFIRQIIGWREFIRGVYVYKGVEERTKNFWKFTNKIPHSFYTASTGIEPLDRSIEKVLKTAYGHHIERLMVLGNFMVLTETNPDEVYRWFMEMFIDAYDWVMVPNVYGMSQFADGGLMATKPYISGSNYLMKMSDIPKGDWQKSWDGLYWHFISTHRDFFLKNPRLGMMVKLWDKMEPVKKESHLVKTEKIFSKLRE